MKTFTGIAASAAIMALAAIALATSVTSANAQAPATPGSSDLVAAANREGKLVVYSVTSSVPALLEDFQKLYPGIKLDYVALDTTPLYDRVVSESKTGATADVLWSSAMDLQIKLVNDGYAARYESPEARAIPSWANWRNEAFGTTFEPVGFVYNKTLLKPSEVPQTRAELLDMVAKDPSRLKDKITAFDPGKSGVGYLMMTQDADAMAAGTFWNVAGALGAMHVFPGTGSGAQFERLSRGDSLLGYDLLTSYATGRIKKDLPNLGIVLPKDHTLVVTRVMFISAKAAHPNAAKVWVDYLLSKRGQEQLARADLGALRADVADDMTPAALGKKLGSAVKPIAVGPELLQHLDGAKHDEFMRRWSAAMAAPQTPVISANFPQGSPTLANIQKRGRLVVGNKFGFQTFNFVNAATGKNEGYMVDVSRALARRILGDENKVEYRKTTDETRFDMLARNEIDVIVDLTPVSEEKLQHANFSDEIFRSGSGLLVKKDSPIKSVADIRKGTRVLFVAENHDIEKLKALAPEATYIDLPSSKEAVAALKAGKGDVFTQVVTHLYRAASQDPGLVVINRFTDKPYLIAVRKDDTVMRDYVNEVVRSMRASGEFDRLFTKWFEPYGGLAAK